MPQLEKVQSWALVHSVGVLWAGWGLLGFEEGREGGRGEMERDIRGGRTVGGVLVDGGRDGVRDDELRE